MAQEEEPLYDFPEPAQPSQCKFQGHQRGRGSLRSISVLDRLLLTVPVWLQLSINPATALHILRREPPGTFLVRKSRTSQRNVLCLRLADDSVPSFVQQFGIREEQCSKTFSLETSAISFPDLPRLISFYCVSRDVLPFPLELPEAIAKATSHKELESISHMGVEFWSSHLNVRGPRAAPKHKEGKDQKPNTVTSASSAIPVPKGPGSTPQPDSDFLLNAAPESDTTASKQSDPSATLFQEFCPITTRSPRELDCGSGLGALCFINPLFLQSQSSTSRRRMFKRSLKVRVSTETSTLLSPPLAPPPPPPLIPKSKGKQKIQKQRQDPIVSQSNNLSKATQSDPTSQDNEPPTQTQETPSDQTQPSSAASQGQTETEKGQTQDRLKAEEATDQLPTVMEHSPEDSDYLQPSSVMNVSHSASLSSYLSPAAPPMPPPLLPKLSPSLSPHSSPLLSPALSPYQSPFLFLHDSPSASPSISPYQSPSPSPKVPFSLSPFTSSPVLSPQLEEQAYHTPATPSRPDQQRPEGNAQGEGAGADGNGNEDEGVETNEELEEKEDDEEEKGLILQMNTASLNDTGSCSSFDSLEEAAETPPHSPNNKENNCKSLEARK